MMKFKKSIAFLITLAMFMTFALPVFAVVTPEATYGFVTTNSETKIETLSIKDDNNSKVQLAKWGNDGKFQGTKNGDLVIDENITVSGDSISLAVEENPTGNNPPTLVITPIANGETTITYTNGGDTAELKVTVDQTSSEDPKYQFVLAKSLKDIPNNEFTYSDGMILLKIRKADGSYVNDYRINTDNDNVLSENDIVSVQLLPGGDDDTLRMRPLGAGGYGEDTITYTATDGSKAVLKVNATFKEGFFQMDSVLCKELAISKSDEGAYNPVNLFTRSASGSLFHPEQTDLHYNKNNLTVAVATLEDGFAGVIVTPKNNIGGTLTYSKDGFEFSVKIIPKPTYQFMNADSSTEIIDNKITLSDSSSVPIQLTRNDVQVTAFDEVLYNVKSRDTGIVKVTYEEGKTFRIEAVATGSTYIDYDDADGSTARLKVTVENFAEPEEPVDRNGLWFITGNNYNTGEDSFYHENNATNLVNNGSSTDVSNDKYEYDCVIADKNGKIGTSITSNMVTFGTEGVLEFAPDSQNKGFFKIIAIGNGTTTIEVVVDGKTYTTKDFTVTGVPKPENISKTIDAAYIEALTGNDIYNPSLPIRLLPGVTITGTTDKVKIIDLADNEWGRDTYLVLPTSNPTSDETIELALSNSAKLIITLKANLNDYFLPMLKLGGGEYTPHLLGFHEFGDPKALTIEMFSNIANPTYKMESTTGKTFTFVMNDDGKTITANFDVAKDGYTELFGTFLIYTKTDKSDTRQYPVTSIFSGQGNKGNPYHKDGDDSLVYWSESTYDKTTQTAFFTVAKFNSAYNAYWGKDADPKQVNNGDVVSVKYEIPTKYNSDNDLKNLSLGNGGVAKAGNYMLFEKEFKGVYGMKVLGIPENYTKPIYLKQTVTYNNITSNPPAVNAEFNNNFVYYVQLSDGYSNPENHEIDLADDKYKDYTIQQAINEGGEGVTVKLKENTPYKENIAIPFYARIQGREGSVIKAATNAPVIKSTSSMRPVELYDVTIDGNNTSIGIETKGGGFVSIGDLNNPEKHSSIIQNCTVGVKVPKDGGVVNCIIKGNTIGIEFFQKMEYGLVAQNTVTDNGTGVKFTTGYEFGMPYGSFEAQHNIVKENTTKNVKAEIGDDKAEFRNNFIELGTDGVPTNIDGKPIIHPYFKTESMDTVTAKVDELTTTQKGEKEIPYITHDAMDNMAPTVDKQVFTDIMAITAKGRAAVKPTPALIEGYSNGSIAYSFLINEITTPLDFNTRFDSKVAKPEIITASKAANGKNRPVSFKHNGDMPGKTVVTLSDTTGKYKAGDKLFLYLLNPTTNKLEFSGNVTVTEVNGVIYLTFVMDHCSDYLITDVDINAAPPVDNTTPAPPSYSGGGYGGGGSVISSGDVANAISNAPNGTATIDITSTPIMSSESFSELAKSPNTTLVLNGDGYSWSFSGRDISPYAQAIAFNTQISKYSPNIAQLTKAAGNVAFEPVYFSFHGELPGKATVRVQTGFKNETVKVYYFNAAKKQFEYSGEAVVNSNGIAAFSITHCSDYVLSRTALTNAVENPKDTSTTPPSTGVDSYNWMNIILLIAMISITAIIGVKKINVGK